MGNIFKRIRKQDSFMNLNGGLWFKALSKEKYQFKSKINDNHLDSNGYCRSSFISTLFDAGIGASVQSYTLERFSNTDSQPTVTILLSINYFKEIKNLGLLIGTAKVIKKTKNLIFMSSNLYFKREKIASASGVWKIIKKI